MDVKRGKTMMKYSKKNDNESGDKHTNIISCYYNTPIPHLILV